ncbi:XRE family transcriptional regulator [Achromobacter sp.]|uniref:XRE family transcriptional regulator n=1 Tax=Achromobacter sp. TaxID=134375 RepID=UPI000ED5ACED|nr:XRE family transcriptional regulator [Achromobacter sp.]HAP24893.1 XRE family transcriptional regulator [Achromobacter sp.]
MSDTALKNARMSDALERSLIREAIKAETLSGPYAGSRWLRLKLRMAALGGAVGEVLHNMDAGRRQHPVVSAYH